MSDSTFQINHNDDASFEVVFKIQETCNINCTYCYMYNVGNEAYKIAPPQASIETCVGVAKFISHEFNTRKPQQVSIVLHGGEPMLMKPREMEKRLAAMFDYIDLHAEEGARERISLGMQTNGTLVSPEWIELLKRWNISVGVSIDGPQRMHDRRRVDKRERGTYKRTIEGIEQLLSDPEMANTGVGALCVIDPEENGAEVYRHLANDLGIRGFNFLLPFMNWDNYDPEVVKGVGRFLVEAFREWVREAVSGKRRHIRTFSEAVESVYRSQTKLTTDQVTFAHYVVVVESDGSVMTEESLRPTYSGFYSNLNIASTTLENVLDSPEFIQVAKDTHRLPEECRECALVSACRGGAALGRVGMRYSSQSEELRKSVYCEAFIDLYVEIARLIRQSGRDLDSFFASAPTRSLEYST